MENNSQNLGTKITFKPTSPSLQPLILLYEASKLMAQYKQQLSVHLAVPTQRLKLVFRGKILNDSISAQKAQLNKLESPTVMVAMAPERKEQKPKPTSQQQTVPNAGMNTGLGGTSPMGFSNYSMVNHPGYMSAISGAMNQQKMQEMLDDPFYQEMIQEMMQDPDTMQHLMQENPMMKKMVQDNPMMKMVLSNKEMLKAVFNPQTMKMAKQMYKKNGDNTQGGIGGIGTGLGGSQPVSQLQNPNQFSNMQQNPFGMGMNPFMMGMMNQPQSTNNTNISPLNASATNTSNINPQQQPNGFMNPYMMGMNPYMMGVNPYMMGNTSMMGFNNPNNVNSTQPNNNNYPYSNPMMNPFFSMMNNSTMPINQPSNENLEEKYEVQLVQLQSMGFTDKTKNLQALKLCFGNVQAAVERLFKTQ